MKKTLYETPEEEQQALDLQEAKASDEEVLDRLRLKYLEIFGTLATDEQQVRDEESDDEKE